MRSCSDGEQSVRNPAEQTAPAPLELRDVTRRYSSGGGVEEISLSIAEGETLAILGPSGAGKSTLVNLVVGIESPDSGNVLIDGVDVTNNTPRRRKCSAVFQDIPLYDHLKVFENILLATSSLNLSPNAATTRVHEAVKAVEIESLEGRRAERLSGGERARVAIARILARSPRVALLDEPYAAVDRLFRVPLRRLLRDRLAEAGCAVLHVTHSTEEALDVANRIAVIAEGRLRQVGTPEQIRENPEDDLVAALFADPID